MNLREQGFRFCVSPCKIEAKWIHAIEYKVLYSDWNDVTEWDSEILVNFLLKPVDSNLNTL